MATRVGQGSAIAPGVWRNIWSGLLNGDDGAAYSGPTLPDKCIQVTGTFGVGGTVIIEGSNNGTNWNTLVDPQGNALSFTVQGLETLLDNPFFVRPRVTAGDGTTNLVVTLISRSGLR